MVSALSTELLAAFEDADLLGRRKYQLFPDRVVLSGGNGLGSDFEVIFRLSELSPVSNQYSNRSNDFWFSLLGTVLSWAGLLWLYKEQGVDMFATKASGVLIPAAIACMFLLIATRHRQQLVQFPTLQGGNGLVVTGSTRNAKQLQEFIEKVRERVPNCSAASP